MLKKVQVNKEEKENVTRFEDFLPGQRLSKYPTAAIPAGSSCVVGECVENKHPYLQGRALVSWRDSNGKRLEKWLPVLCGTTVRVSDRVLLMSPENWPEPIIVGVVDGFALRPEKERVDKVSLELERDESVSVVTSNGEKLLEVFYEDSGPVVKLLKEDVQVEMPGNLRLCARSINLEAKTGEVVIKASEDVKIEGEVVHLN